MKNNIIENYPDLEFMFADGFDDAIIGIDERTFNVIYSTRKCLNILEKEMTPTDALEYFSFNVSGAYMGPKTPIFCNDDI